MEIECPECAEVYDVPEERLLEGASSGQSKVMKCARCQAIFSLGSARSGAAVPKRESGKRTSTARWLWRTLVLLVIVLSVIILAYVAFRNDWVISFEELPEQVEVALVGEPEEPEHEALKRLEVTLEEGYKLVIRDNDPILVVKGEIFNPAPAKRTNIILEGRIIDSAGNTRFETRAPCGRVFSNRKLKRTKRGSFANLFSGRKGVYNCSLKSKAKKKFQLIFDNMPPDYDEDYTVQVKTLFAGHEAAGSTQKKGGASGSGTGPGKGRK